MSYCFESCGSDRPCSVAAARDNLARRALSISSAVLLDLGWSWISGRSHVQSRCAAAKEIHRWGGGGGSLLLWMDLSEKTVFFLTLWVRRRRRNASLAVKIEGLQFIHTLAVSGCALLSASRCGALELCSGWELFQVLWLLFLHFEQTQACAQTVIVELIRVGRVNVNKV